MEETTNFTSKIKTPLWNEVLKYKDETGISIYRILEKALEEFLERRRNAKYS